MPRKPARRVRDDQTFSSAVRRLPPAATAGLASSYNMTSLYDNALGALEMYAVLVDRRDAILWSSAGTCDEPMCCPDVRELRATIADGLRAVPSISRPIVVRLLAALDARAAAIAPPMA